ncbi:MAG TPA: GxxExxY protein, partial [Gemmatimonadaceae bacterium]|nr:GxxExxY protein [Gemmatimonadaceae bacterium]
MIPGALGGACNLSPFTLVRPPAVDHEELTGRIIGCAMTVQRALGPGHLESVYQNALAHELRKAALVVECRKGIQVRYDGQIVGDFVADMLVDGCVIVENKALRALARTHEAQLVNYLTATGIEIGLLLNFGAERLEFRRKTRTYRPRS